MVLDDIVEVQKTT